MIFFWQNFLKNVTRYLKPSMIFPSFAIGCTGQAHTVSHVQTNRKAILMSHDRTDVENAEDPLVSLQDDHWVGYGHIKPSLFAKEATRAGAFFSAPKYDPSEVRHSWAVDGSEWGFSISEFTEGGDEVTESTPGAFPATFLHAPLTDWSDYEY